MENERYHPSVLTSAELHGCFECKQCGSVVRDTEVHDNFHTIFEFLIPLVVSNKPGDQKLVDVLEKIVNQLQTHDTRINEIAYRL